jgi:DNA-binding IclR family transcriptional regulator
MDTLRQPAPGGNRITAVGVLDRSVTLLDLLGAGPRSLRWLADVSGLPRPTAYRLLIALEAHRLVARDGTGAFRLGPRLTELALQAGPALDLATLAGPVLTRLHEATGESVQLYVRSGDHRLCIAARDSGTGLRDSVPVGAVLPLDAGSGGKVLLAWAPDASTGGLPAGLLTPQLAAELATVRKRGWAASIAEREPGVASVSAPVLTGAKLPGPDLRSPEPRSPEPRSPEPRSPEPRSPELLGALCVSGPASRLGQAPGRRLAPKVIEAAADLARLARPPAALKAPASA